MGMTRDQVKQKIIDAFDADVCTHEMSVNAVADLAEEIMKIWDNGWTWEVPKKSHDYGLDNYGPVSTGDYRD
jgi:hypothetical protein